MPNLYCMSCRKKTANASEPKKVTTGNGRHMLRTKCAICGTVKTQFTK